MKIISIRKCFRVTVVTLLMTIICALSYAQFAGGQGTEEDPWQVSRAAHLNAVRDHMDAHFIQIEDIDLGNAPWNQGEGWDPIGHAGSNFSGVYDGNGHIINGLFIDRPNLDYVGLFAFSRYDAVIKNLGLTNINVTGNNWVGGLLGRNLSQSKVINCFTTGSVVGHGERIGGIVGYNQNRDSNVVNCYSRASVTGGTQVGGLVGHNRNNAAITGSYSSGRVNGDGELGGLAGFTQDWGDDPPDNNYWDVETSDQEGSAVGIGRQTRQMIHPYDDETYVGWDFEELWDHDPTHQNNDGYPVLYYQDFEPPVIIDPPVVAIEITTTEDTDNVLITWQAVEDANSYKIYVSDTPDVEDWGEPVAITEYTQFVTPVQDEDRAKFYHVTASIEEAP